jgi:indole-3-glycerol phosphate synthase
MNHLKDILAVKRSEIEALRPRAAELYEKARQRSDFRDFKSTLRRSEGRIRVIAEVKKASPSAGIIAASFDPVEISKNYESGGADAISILTDDQFFQGHLDYLAQVRATVALPLLRKDFILDELQIVQSVGAGADAILLIVAALSQKELIRLREVAASHRLYSLVEVHTSAEMNRALDAGASIIGINNRDLGTFTVDLSVTEKLSQEVPKEIVVISESGIKTADDAARMAECGIDAILVGEALMRGQVSIESLRRN